MSGKISAASTTDSSFVPLSTAVGISGFLLSDVISDALVASSWSAGETSSVGARTAAISSDSEALSTISTSAGAVGCNGKLGISKLATPSLGLSPSSLSKITSPSSSKPSSSKSIKASIRASFCFGSGDNGISRGLFIADFSGASSPNPSPMLKALIRSCLALALELTSPPAFLSAESLGVCFAVKSLRLPMVGPASGVFSSSFDSGPSFSCPPFFSNSACFAIFSSRLLVITSQNRESRWSIVS
mmetsp:Transcript_15781/g.37920  ORF Transcript_15781/g.37920 Transcript_15781/m.37920 type:complete len:245 (+) Transcript_15781:259-993(+)